MKSAKGELGGIRRSCYANVGVTRKQALGSFEDLLRVVVCQTKFSIITRAMPRFSLAK
jgi:hypothetical protein